MLAPDEAGLDDAPISRRRYERERAARQAAERLLEEKSRELYEAEQARTQFLAVVSHELRTPINGILGSAQALSPLLGAGGGPSYLRNIEGSARDLLAQINMLLDLAHMDAGVKSLRSDTVRLDDVLRDALPAQSSAQPISLMINEAARRAKIEIDATALRGAVRALVENAVKFANGTEVKITADLEDMGRLTITVEDGGPGVPPADRSRIFERFFQGESFDTRIKGGTGLGLPFAADVAKLMDGKISVGTSPLGGACFTFVGMTRIVEMSSTGSRAPDLAGLNVLIVEDNPINQVVAKAALATAQMTNRVAANGLEALQKLQQERFDLVLMDIQMPVMNGIEAIKCIRNSPELYSDVPIIVVTANTLGNGSETYAEIGADTALAKPFEFTQLMDSIDRVMRYRERGTAA